MFIGTVIVIYLGLTPRTNRLVILLYIHKKRGASSLPGPHPEGSRIALIV